MFVQTCKDAYQGVFGNVNTSTDTLRQVGNSQRLNLLHTRTDTHSSTTECNIVALAGDLTLFLLRADIVIQEPIRPEPLGVFIDVWVVEDTP